MEEEADYPVHKAVFENDLKKLSQYLRKYDVAAKDKHGKHNYFIFCTLSFSCYNNNTSNCSGTSSCF